MTNILADIFRHIKRAAGIVLGGATALLILWSLCWVATRPLRDKKGREGKTEITIIHWGDRAEDEIVESLCASFEAVHTNIIIKRINATAGYTSKLQTMIAGGNPPDLFFWNSHMLPNYVNKDIILDIEDFLAADIAGSNLPFNFNDIYPQTLNSFRFDGTVTGRGKLYGLPTTFTPLGFYYNKTLFDKAGVPYPTDDWTWEEFEQKARAIGKLDNSYGAEFYINDVTVRLFLQSYGQDLYSDGFKELHMQDPEVLRLLQRLSDWRFGPDAGRMLTSAKSMVETGESAFLSGKIGMFGPVGRWVVPNFREIHDFDWDFAQMPRGTYRTNMIYVAAWCIAKNSKHPYEAWLVARHFARPECQAISSRYGLVLPTLREVAKGPDCVNATIKPYRDDLFLTAVDRSSAMQWPAEPEFTEYLNVALDESLRMGTISVDEAMRNVRTEWDKTLASPLRGDTFPPVPWKQITLLILGVIAILIPVLLAVLWFTRPGKFFFREELAGYAMISPWIIGLLVFIAIPMVVSLLLGFSKWSGVATLDHAQWVGLKNWTEMLFHDKRMLRSMWVTVYYVILMVPLGQLLALGVALIMSWEVRGIAIYRSVWYLPTVLAGVGMAVMWLWVFDAQHGLMNGFLAPLLKPFGLQPPEWFLKDAKWFGVPAYVITSFWSVGGPMLIYLAGLHAIPKTLYESARIDGAGHWAQFRNITIPMLSPVILFNIIMAIIGSFQIFTQAFVMTQGGPGDATRFYVLYLYNKAFELYEMGYASAMAWLLFIIVLLLTLLTFYASKKRVYYEGARV